MKRSWVQVLGMLGAHWENELQQASGLGGQVNRMTNLCPEEEKMELTISVCGSSLAAASLAAYGEVMNLA